MDRLLKPNEAAELLAVSVDQLSALTDEGALPFVNVGLPGKRPTKRYEPADIEAFRLERRQVAESPAPAAEKMRRGRTAAGFETLADIRARFQRERAQRPKVR